MFQNFQGITPNLQKLERQLLEVANSNVHLLAAMERTRERVLPLAIETLTILAMDAIENSEEFNLPVFRSAILTAINDQNTYLFELLGETPRVTIDLERTAGSIEEYVTAVETVRESFGGGGEEPSASYIWINYIYGIGREGRTFDDSLMKKYSGKYESTISARLGNYSSLAPWWYLLEHGNQYPGRFPGKGGTPYPSYDAYRFTSKARDEIQIEFEQAYQNELVQIDQQLDTVIQAREMLDKIADAIERAESTPYYNVPFEILDRIIVDGREYQIYITRTGRLGGALPTSIRR